MYRVRAVVQAGLATMHVQDEEALRKYLMGSLQPLCEAEPAMLADYVISLLKNDHSRRELVALCERELIDFLEGNTKVRTCRKNHTKGRGNMPPSSVCPEASAPVHSPAGLCFSQIRSIPSLRAVALASACGI